MNRVRTTSPLTLSLPSLPYPFSCRGSPLASGGEEFLSFFVATLSFLRNRPSWYELCWLGPGLVRQRHVQLAVTGSQNMTYKTWTKKTQKSDGVWWRQGFKNNERLEKLAVFWGVYKIPQLGGLDSPDRTHMTPAGHDPV